MRRPKIDKLEDCLTSIDTLDNKASFQLINLLVYLDRLERKITKLDLRHIDNILKYRDNKPNYQEEPGRLVDTNINDDNTNNDNESTEYVNSLEQRLEKQNKVIFDKISKPDTGKWKEVANKNKQDFIKPTIDDLKEYFIFGGTLYYKNLPCKLVTFNVKTYQGLVQKTRCAIEYINSGYVQNVSINDLLIKVTNHAQYIGAPGEEQ